MNRFATILLILVFATTLLVSCSQVNNATPEEAVHSYMELVKTKDNENIARILAEDSKDELPFSAGSMLHATLLGIAENFEYEVIESNIKDDTATVLTHISTTGVNKELQKELDAQKEERKEESDNELGNIITESVIDMLTADGEDEYQIALHKEDDKWLISLKDTEKANQPEPPPVETITIDLEPEPTPTPEPIPEPTPDVLFTEIAYSSFEESYDAWLSETLENNDSIIEPGFFNTSMEYDGVVNTITAYEDGCTSEIQYSKKTDMVKEIRFVMPEDGLISNNTFFAQYITILSLLQGDDISPIEIGELFAQLGYTTQADDVAIDTEHLPTTCAYQDFEFEMLSDDVSYEGSVITLAITNTDKEDTFDIKDQSFDENDPPTLELYDRMWMVIPVDAIDDHFLAELAIGGIIYHEGRFWAVTDDTAENIPADITSIEEEEWDTEGDAGDEDIHRIYYCGGPCCNNQTGTIPAEHRAIYDGYEYDPSTYDDWYFGCVEYWNQYNASLPSDN